jgi:hypothetical protein
MVTINTRDWSIRLFNWSIPYLIDHSHVLRLLLSNWLISIGFIIRSRVPRWRWQVGTSLPVFYYTLFILFTLFFLYLYAIIQSIDRHCLFDYLEFLLLALVTQEQRKSGAQYHVTPHLPLNIYEWLHFCESFLLSLTKHICNFRQCSTINRKSYCTCSSRGLLTRSLKSLVL